MSAAIPAKPEGAKAFELPPPKLAYKYWEAAALLSLSERVLSRLVTEGKIRPIEGKKIIAHAELERFLKVNSKKRDGRRGAYRRTAG